MVPPEGGTTNEQPTVQVIHPGLHFGSELLTQDTRGACSLWMSRMLSLPSISIELTPRCNQRCIYCYNPWRGAPSPATEEMDTGQVCELIDRVLGPRGHTYSLLL